MTVPVLLENITEWFELRTPRLNYNAAYIRVNDYMSVYRHFSVAHTSQYSIPGYANKSYAII